MAHLSLADNNYPKILTIPNSGKNDTVIAFTNEQVIKFNQNYVILKECIEYSNIQDSIILSKDCEILKLEQIKNTALKADSLSRKSLYYQYKLTELKDGEITQLNSMIKDQQKQFRKNKAKTWFLNSFVITPIVFTIGVISTYFSLK